jgi:hypothetical protein
MNRLFILLFLFMLVACKQERRNNEITKISFARMGAWSDPGAAISIDSS